MPVRNLFADSFYWIALLFPRDVHHGSVVALSRKLGTAQLLTTDEALSEVLNHFCRFGPYWRFKAAALVHQVRSDPQVEVLPQTRADFDAAVAFYESRSDKEYSLVDCRSMLAARAAGIAEVLSNDHHFTQEGFTVLFP